MRFNFLESQAMRDNLLGGRYRVVNILAVGGFGQTYVALDTHRPNNKCRQAPQAH